MGKTGGTGIKQLRENIAESKLSYEIMDDAAQAFLKSKIMDNIHKYFYIIAFAGYIRQEGGRGAARQRQVLHPRQGAEAGGNLRGLHEQELQAEGHGGDRQGQPPVGEGHSPRSALQPREPGQD